MTEPTASGFGIDDLSVGPFAHGFGTTDDGRPFAFRTRRATLSVQIYRPDLGETVPTSADVVAEASAQVTDIDLDDERSIVAFVRDLIDHAHPVHRPESSVRGILGRIGAVIDGM